MANAVDQNQWIEAGRATRQLIDELQLKHSAVARRVGMSAPNLSKTLNGRRAATERDCTELEKFLSERLEDRYSPGTLTGLWFADTEPTTEDQAAERAEAAPAVNRHKWALAALALYLAAGLLFIRMRQPSETAQAQEKQAHCSPDVGEMAETVPFELHSWRSSIGRAYSNALSSYNSPCPTQQVGLSSSNGGLLQPMVDRDGRRAVIVATSPDRATVVTHEQWLSLFAARASAAVVTQIDVPDLPLRVEARNDSRIVALETGALVGAGATSPHFYLPAAFLQAWIGGGGAESRLGRPLTHPYRDERGRVAIDFELGRMVAELDPTVEGSIGLVTPVYDFSGGLPASIAADGGLVATQDGTVWQVIDGERRWVADASTRRCLGTAAAAVWGHTLANLRPGPAATCEES